MNYRFEYFLLIGLIASLTITDTEHFLFSIPLIILVIASLFQSRDLILMIITLIAFVFYVGTWGDILGSYSAKLEQLGSVGIGNLILLGVSIRILLTFRRKYLKSP